MRVPSPIPYECPECPKKQAEIGRLSDQLVMEKRANHEATKLENRLREEISKLQHDLSAAVADFLKSGSGFAMLRLSARLLVWLMFFRFGGPVIIFVMCALFFAPFSASMAAFVIFLLSTGLVYWDVFPLMSSIYEAFMSFCTWALTSLGFRSGSDCTLMTSSSRVAFSSL